MYQYGSGFKRMQMLLISSWLVNTNYSVYEITLGVKGRKSGRDIPRPVWFVHEGNTLYLLPNYGSDTNWYKNFLANQTLKISVSDEELPA
jgi:hypothetical protein